MGSLLRGCKPDNVQVELDSAESVHGRVSPHFSGSQERTLHPEEAGPKDPRVPGLRFTTAHVTKATRCPG